MVKTDMHRVVYVTTGSYESALHLARILVSEKVAACCSIVSNVTSVYSWDSAIQERNEYLMIIKTSADKLELLKERVLEIHSDDVPEIISLAITEGSKEYLDWMNNSLNAEK